MIEITNQDTFNGGYLWDIEAKNGLATKQYRITIESKTKKIEGDVVAHGGWYDLEEKECLEILRKVFSDEQYNDLLAYIK